MNALAACGLSGAEQAAYEMLVDQASATLPQLAAVWVRAEPIEAAITSLERRGLISSDPGPPIRYAAISPALAFRPLLLDHEEQLTAARGHAAVLDAAHRSSRQDACTIVEAVTGANAVRQRLLQIRRSARHDVRCLDTVPAPDTGDDQPMSVELRRDDVTFRAIYDQPSLQQSGALAALEELTVAGQQVRVLPQLPLRLYIADGRLAFLPRPSARPCDAAVIVHACALLDGLIKLFDALWQRALPLQPAPKSVPRERQPALDQQRLITLLLSGLTDDAIARHLGISSRSVQRHVAALMADLGAHTRFQAGAQAALRNRSLRRADNNVA